MISIKKRNQGFTIVELLIVIVVIGILALLVLTTYSGIQGKARNSKRQTDLASLQTHLEAYYNDNGYYPNNKDMNNTNGDTTFTSTKLNGLDQTALIDPSSKTATVAAAPAKNVYSYVATDSSGSAPNCESDHTTCAKYTLTATYEGNVNGATTYVKNSLN